METIKRKINALLQLAENNSNENEAKSALLKAQEMMGKYCLNEKDIQGEKKEEVLFLRVEFLRRNVFWKSVLSKVVADAFGCFSYCSDKRIGNVRTLSYFIVGKKVKVEVARSVYRSAVKMAERLSIAKGRYKGSYLRGFVDGLEKGFQRQKSVSEWGLVLVVDEETIEARNKLSLKRVTATVSNEKRNYEDGVVDGENFASNYQKENEQLEIVTNKEELT